MKAFIVYFSDRTGKVVVCSGMSSLALNFSDEELSNVVKIELIPFEVL